MPSAAYAGRQRSPTEPPNTSHLDWHKLFLMQMAIETTDIASSTVAELHRQGQQLDLSIEGVAEVGWRACRL